MRSIALLTFLSLCSTVGFAEESKKESMQVTAKRIKQGSSKALLDERRSSNEVKDVISSEQISKSGDSDAGSAMRRVTGLTLIGGKSVYVRGLGERYSATTLNGLNVPSPDPARRQVQFDLFPAEVLESIVVQKSYSPDLPGEFGGGAALLRTKTIPNRFEGRISLGTGFTTDKVNAYQHSSTDWAGVDDGSRSLPDGLKGQSLTQTSGLSGEQREALSEAFPRIYNVREESAPINRSFSAALGDRIPLGSTPLGYSVGLTYGDEWNRYDRIQNEYTSDLSTVVKGKRGDISEREIKLGGIGVLSADIGTNQLRGLVGVLRKTTDAVDITDSFNMNTSSNNFRSTRLQWQERDLVLRQLFGEHALTDDGGVSLSWRAGLTSTTRSIPDQRSYGYNDRGDSLVHDQSDLSRLRRKWFDNNEDMQEAQIDLKANIFTGDENQFDVKTGILAMRRERKSGAREFFFTPTAVGSPAAALGERPLEDIYTPENMRYNETQGQGFLLAEEVTLPSDTYQADQDLQGVYAMLQYKHIDGIELTTGVRRELSRQNVDSIDSFDSRDPYKKAELESNAVLPVLNATWAFSDSQQLRFAYSRTVARPDFRELSVSSYYDYERGIDIRGNPELDFSEIDNFDLRWELYQTGGDYISFGLFHKNISRPIEQIPASNDGANTSAITYTNADRARNYGFEVESSQRVGHFLIGGNYSRMFSDISAPSGENSVRYTNTKRPMQGAAPYVVNVNTGFRVDSSGSEANLVYNRVGARIMEAGIVVGTNEVPDVKDVPMDSLDLVLSQELEGNTSIRFRARNLLGRDVEYRVADRLVYQRTQDPSYAVSISSTF
jgi:outer membrane receptor protein involved in Fe transport